MKKVCSSEKKNWVVLFKRYLRFCYFFPVLLKTQTVLKIAVFWYVHPEAAYSSNIGKHLSDFIYIPEDSNFH
jgi:hypothetical protein